jgi:ParB/RepB/Spo0J family partition protein
MKMPTETNDQQKNEGQKAKPTKRPRGAGTFATKSKAQVKTPSQEGATRTFAPAGASPIDNGQKPGFKRITPDAGAINEPHSGNEPLTVLPYQIKAWKFQDRQLSELDDDPEYAALVEEIRNQWVLTPIIVRPIKHGTDSQYLYEEIAGFKRLQAAMSLDRSRPILVVVKDVNDIEALQIQRSENEGRSKPCTWSMALFYKKVLDEGISESPKSLALSFSIDRTSVYHHIRMAEKMPEDFKTSLNLNVLSYNALNLLVTETSEQVGTDKADLIDLIIECADDLAEKPHNAVKILQKVIDDFKSRNMVRPPAPERKVFKAKNGKVLTTMKTDKALSFTLHETAMSLVSYEEVESAITEILNKKGFDMS